MRKLSLLLLLALVLSACAAPTSAPPPQATATAAAGAPTLTAATAAPTVTPVPPEPTAPPPFIAYLTGGEPHSAAAGAAIERAAQEFGWRYERPPEPSIETLDILVRSGAAVVVFDSPALDAHALSLAPDAPHTFFIRLGYSAAGDAPANMLILGGPASRQDQAGFIAGVAAALATQSRFVAVAGDPNSAEDRKYRNGFLHGVRYTCPKCRVDFIDAAGTEDPTSAGEKAVRHVLFGADVIFAAASPAGEAALVAAARRGAWVIGSSGDAGLTLFDGGAAPGAERVLTSIYLDIGGVLYAALEAIHAGERPSGTRPLSAANGAVVVAPYREPTGALSALDQKDIAAALQRLTDSSLETGIDPLTGEPR